MNHNHIFFNDLYVAFHAFQVQKVSNKSPQRYEYVQYVYIYLDRRRKIKILSIKLPNGYLYRVFSSCTYKKLPIYFSNMLNLLVIKATCLRICLTKVLLHIKNEIRFALNIKKHRIHKCVQLHNKTYLLVAKC